MQAAFLRVKLKYLDEENNMRRDIAKHYLERIKNPRIVLPDSNVFGNHVWHLFVVRCDNRSNFQQYLAEKNIQTIIHYPVAPHNQAAYKNLKHLTLPITEKIHQEVISLPISQVIATNDVLEIVEAVNEFQS